jgi:hypothetical protein
MNEKITPWIVSKNKIIEFHLLTVEEYYIFNVLPHDENNYLVLTKGYYPFISDRLERLLKDDLTDTLNFLKNYIRSNKLKLKRK